MKLLKNYGMERLVDELRAFVQAGATLSPPFAHPGVDITR
jgi:hypothetical protein